MIFDKCKIFKISNKSYNLDYNNRPKYLCDEISSRLDLSENSNHKN